MSKLARRILPVLTALAIAAPAQAWGPQAHRVITQVAVDRLTPQAAKAVRELLFEGDTLVGLASWADHEGHDAVPNGAGWHYVNVSITSPRFEENRHARGDNVVTKIKHYRAVLADKKAPKRERQRALLFLVHFVEDIHQPLHVGDHDDRGGNLTQVQFFGEGTNLHRLWDSDLIHRIGGNDRAWVDRLERQITPASAKKWSEGGVDAWADESLQEAKKAYRGPGRETFLNSGAILGEDYVKFAEPILREQMARAAVRLADELNATFK